MSHFVWRQARSVEDDERRRSDGKPLRKRVDLGFLSNIDQSHNLDATAYCLCESQISCVVTGFNNRIWSAYCMVDDGFDAQDDLWTEPEPTEPEIESEKPPFDFDPLAAGKIPADRPIWNPRVYFLKVLKIRAEQIAEHWAVIKFMLGPKIQTYVRMIRSTTKFC